MVNLKDLHMNGEQLADMTFKLAKAMAMNLDMDKVGHDFRELMGPIENNELNQMIDDLVADTKKDFQDLDHALDDVKENFDLAGFYDAMLADEVEETKESEPEEAKD